MAPRGRPTKLTPELQEKIVDAIRRGNYMETAAAYAEVDKASLYAWLKRGNRQKKGIHRNFLNAVEKALAYAEVHDVDNIREHSVISWQASAWRLERKFPDRWGRKERVELSGDQAKPITLKVVYGDDGTGAQDQIAEAAPETGGLLTE